MREQQCEATTKQGRRCRIMGRRLCDIHSGAKTARRERYGLPHGEQRLLRAEAARRAS